MISEEMSNQDFGFERYFFGIKRSRFIVFARSRSSSLVARNTGLENGKPVGYGDNSEG